MKQIRLEFPICWGDNPNVYMPSKVYLKVVGNKTEAYLDNEFTKTVPQTTKKISIDVEVPKELEIICIEMPNVIVDGMTPVGRIWEDCEDFKIYSNLRIHNLKKALVIMDKEIIKVPVYNEIPVIHEWKLNIDGSASSHLMKPWALAVYVTDIKTFGKLYWHSKLAMGL